jgi:hypothetical protein
MNVDSLATAAQEARKFLRLVKIVQEEHKALNSTFLVCGGKNSGALRRASMDLTRALAEMRKPG